MVDEWSPGTNPQSTDYPHAETDGIKALIARLSKLATDLRESTSNLLRTAGIYLTEAGMRISSSLRVEGDLEATGSAQFAGSTQIGGTLDVDATSTFDGDAAFHGSVVIDGDLAVPNGSISNAALSNPVTGLTGNTFQAGISAGASSTPVAGVSIVVPAGFTQARVIAISNVGAGNVAVNCFTRIGGSDGGTMTGVSGFASSSHAVSLTGLAPGSTITAQTMIAAIPSYPTCMATTTILAFFFK